MPLQRIVAAGRMRCTVAVDELQFDYLPKLNSGSGVSEQTNASFMIWNGLSLIGLECKVSANCGFSAVLLEPDFIYTTKDATWLRSTKNTPYHALSDCLYSVQKLSSVIFQAPSLVRADLPK